jgi:predicted nucleotidyltransferase
MNPDFVEMLAALSEAEAEFLIVGAHAVAAYSRPRATGDLDIWVHPTPDNAVRVWRALGAFGAPLDELTKTDLETPDLIFQMGVVPSRIDILTSIEGIEFGDAWPNRTVMKIGGVDVAVIGREDLIRNKKAVGRKRDLADVAALEGLE